MKQLTKIANKIGTDKGTEGVSDSYGTSDNFHGYTEFYDQYFSQIRQTKEKVYILEIGIWHGKSVDMFNKYFPECEIYGIDIQDCSQYIKCSNFHMYIFDQGDVTKLDEFVSNCNIKFDIIIDDGSHNSKDLLLSLLYLSKLISENGIYIIEDYHFNYTQQDKLTFAKFAETLEKYDWMDLSLYNDFINRVQSSIGYRRIWNDSVVCRYVKSIYPLLTCMTNIFTFKPSVK